MSTHYYQYVSLDYMERNNAYNISPTDSKGYILWQTFFQYPRNDMFTEQAPVYMNIMLRVK
jgi:hypothetical protein